MIFEAKCMMCGKRQGIELPDNDMRTVMAVNQAQMIQAMQDCSCGGYVEIFTYHGKLDKDRNICGD